MRIALDFDGTFTRDPGMWLDFINSVADNGHQVFIVTARCESKDGIDWSKVTLVYMNDGHGGVRKVGMQGPPCPVIWCDGKPKRSVATDIDIWIDDDPYALVNGSQLTPEQLAEWRKTDDYRNPAHGREGPQGSPDHDRRHRLLPGRPGGNRGSVAQG